MFGFLKLLFTVFTDLIFFVLDFFYVTKFIYFGFFLNVFLQVFTLFTFFTLFSIKTSIQPILKALDSHIITWVNSGKYSDPALLQAQFQVIIASAKLL